MWMEELPNGKYKYFERYRDPYTEKFKKVSTTLKSQSKQAVKQATKILQDKIDKKLSVSQPEKHSIAFKECFDEWFNIYKNTVEDNSAAKVPYSKKIIDNYILPDYLMKNIDVHLLQDMFNDLYYEKNYSFNYVSAIKNHVSLLFTYAETREYISFNPMMKVKIKKKPPTLEEMEKVNNKYLEYAEAKQIISEMRKSPYAKRNADIAEFMLLTGLRIGELLALRENNYDGRFIYVRGTLDYITKKYTDKKVVTTKTYSSRRDVELPTRAREIIDSVIMENELAENDSDFIFTSRSGVPVAIQTINGSLKNFAQKAGIKKTVTSHIFRHTHISLLAEKNVPLKAIMERVGHSDAATTMKIYTHVTEQMKETVIEKLNSLEF